jgi:butyrate kinase
MASYKILVVNPRTNFTKIAIFQNHSLIFLNKVFHPEEELAKFETLIDQHDYRKNIILKELENADINIKNIDAVVGRGGLLKPLKSGVYEVNEKMVNDLINSPLGEDSVNLGGILVNDIVKSIPDAKAYIADPVVVDEMDDIARISGHPEFERKSVFHALNQKFVARNFAKTVNQNVDDLNLIVAHIGMGISVGAHKKGKVVDVNQTYDGEGPFSPKRSGTLPTGDLIRMCYSGKYTKREMLDKVSKQGGAYAYFGTDNMEEVEERALNGDRQALLVYEAMAYQVAKAIGSMFPVMNAQVDAILLTGGLINSKWFVDQIVKRVKEMAPVHIFPGGDEMEALASNVLRVLNEEDVVLEYK